MLSTISDDVKVRIREKLQFISNDSLDIGVCTEFELDVFPKRMNIWLGEILDALVCRKFISSISNNCFSLDFSLFEKISMLSTLFWSMKHVK